MYARPPSEASPTRPPDPPIRPVIVAPVHSEEKPIESSPRAMLRQAAAWQAWFAGAMLTLAIFAALYWAQPVWIPLTAAVLTNFLLKPAVRRLQTLRVPPALSGLALTAALTALLLVCIYKLGEPVVVWMHDAPRHVDEIRLRIGELLGPFEGLTAAAEELQKAADDGTTVPVVVRGDALPWLVMHRGVPVVVMLIAWLMLTFFLLASGDLFLRKLVHIMPRWAQKRGAVEAIRQVEADVSRYLAVRTWINILLGIAVWLSFRALEMPNAGAWALAAAIVNYVPYIGPVVLAMGILAVSLLHYPGPVEAILPALVFTVLNIIEGYVVSPWMFGRGLRLNTVAVFVGLMFWGWLWSIPGLLMAVPLLVCMRVGCQHIPVLTPFAEFLADEKGVEVRVENGS